RGVAVRTCLGSSNRSPAPAILGQQFVGLRRSIAAGLIGREVSRASVGPCIDERLHDAPASLNAVGSLEQDRITDHAIVDQRLVAGTLHGIEIVLVLERHANTSD